MIKTSSSPILTKIKMKIELHVMSGAILAGYYLRHMAQMFLMLYLTFWAHLLKRVLFTNLNPL